VTTRGKVCGWGVKDAYVHYKVLVIRLRERQVIGVI